jgi:xanthine dehydrogenase accessory factor
MSVPHIKPRQRGLPDAGRWLAPLAGHWIEAARTRLSQQPVVARVTVTALRGSAPREAGATMLVDAVDIAGTIGGGRLEWHAVALARELLRDACAPPVRIAELILGPDLGQCCGGRVELWLERLTRSDARWLEDAARRLREHADLAIASEHFDGSVTHRLERQPGARAVRLEHGAHGRVTLFEVPRPRRPHLCIFGAGHVGQALVRLLAELALFDLTWVDSRAELLPAGLPESVTARVCADPAELAAGAPARTRFVVMTHDHALDYQLCRVILERTDGAWLGLIGSASKAARFKSRLLRDGLSRESVSGLNCPIGVPGISSKLPGAIAIAIAAQLLQQEGSAASLPANSATRAEPDPPACAGGCASCGAGTPAAP